MSDKNLPAIQEKQIEAAQMVEKYRSDKALVFVNAEDLKTHELFIPEITLLKANVKDDFHRISGKLMPKSHIVDRIADAAGISFIASECQTRAESNSMYVGRAQGKKRLPDGTWRLSQVHEYEFDIDTRAELDFMNDKNNYYKTDTAKLKHKLEMKKFARARAGTGARMKVIRELVGMPTGLEPKDIPGGQMVFARVALNTERMLKEPEMRNAIIQNAIGATEDIFGSAPERNVTPEQEALPAPEADSEAESEAQGAESTSEQFPGLPPDDEIPGFNEKPPSEQAALRSWFQMRIAEVTGEDTKKWIRDFLDGTLEGKDSQDLETLKKYKEALEAKIAGEAK